MPQWDRYWPLGLVSGALLMAASLTLSVWYLTSLFALPQRVDYPRLLTLASSAASPCSSRRALPETDLT